jgi:hypothetical protein
MSEVIDISGDWVGRPFLTIARSKKRSHWFDVHWGDGTLYHYGYFIQALDVDSMNEEIFQVFKASCSKRSGVFGRGSVNGCVSYVDKDGALIIAGIVEKYFRAALNLLVEAGLTKSKLGRGFDERDARFNELLALHKEGKK